MNENASKIMLAKVQIVPLLFTSESLFSLAGQGDRSQVLAPQPETDPTDAVTMFSASRKAQANPAFCYQKIPFAIVSANSGAKIKPAVCSHEIAAL